MSVLLQDLGFHVVAVVILALGVGATTAIFSVLRGLRNEVLYLGPAATACLPMLDRLAPIADGSEEMIPLKFFSGSPQVGTHTLIQRHTCTHENYSGA